MTPDVSVIMTCYNEGPYIGPAVRSILDQTWADRIAAIIIADDGSQPDTVAVLQDIETWDSRIQILYGPGGVGLPGQRNIAIARTDTEVIAILDGDDLWTPEKLELQLPALADPTIGLVYSDFYGFPDGNLSAARPGGVLDITQGDDLVKTYFLNDPPIIPSTCLIRRSAYDAAGGFDAAVKVFEDTDFYLRIAGVCRFALVDTPVLYKRARGSSITGGRKDLMAHHAYVAFKAAVIRPDLLTFVPRRLAERARKLGNQRFLMGDAQEGARLLRLAISLDVLNLRAWTSWFAAGLFPGLTYRLLGSRLKARRAALGAVE